MNQINLIASDQVVLAIISAIVSLAVVWLRQRGGARTRKKPPAQ